MDKVVGIIQFKNKILVGKVLQDKIADFGGLIYVFPGGTVNEGESLENAVIREINEETALIIDEVSLIGSRIHPKTGQKISYFYAQTQSDTVSAIGADNDDIESLEWLELENLFEKVPTIYSEVSKYLLNINAYSFDFEKCKFSKIKSIDKSNTQIMLSFYKEILEAEYKYDKDRVTSDENISKQIEFLKDSLKKSGFELFIISNSGVNIGFLALQDEYNLEADYYFTYIPSLLISKNYRGKGYGKTAMNFSKKIARLKGYSHIGLNVLPYNVPALNLCKSQGFTEYEIKMMAKIVD